MKTRIKIIEKNNGEKTFVAQAKSQWNDFDIEMKMRIMLIPFFGWLLGLTVLSYYDDLSTHNSLLDAQKEIDDMLQEQKRNREKELGDKTKSTTYLKYP